MSKTKELLERLREDNPNAVLLDGLDKAIIGIGQIWGSRTVAVYSAKKIIEQLQKQNDWGYETALEWFGFNIECLYAGPGTPFIMDDHVDN